VSDGEDIEANDIAVVALRVPHRSLPRLNVVGIPTMVVVAVQEPQQAEGGKRVSDCRWGDGTPRHSQTRCTLGLVWPRD
jgi:hypothetical protein